MRLLLDTHIFLWLISGDKRLPTAWEDAISDLHNTVFLSVASVWEAIVKYQIGKLPLPESPEIYLPNSREHHQISSLALEEPDVTSLAALPPLHRDPFDRMLICQALTHQLTLVTDDAVILTYPVSIL